MSDKYFIVKLIVKARFNTRKEIQRNVFVITDEKQNAADLAFEKHKAFLEMSSGIMIHRDRIILNKSGIFVDERICVIANEIKDLDMVWDENEYLDEPGRKY